MTGERLDEGLAGDGFQITERGRLIVEPTRDNGAYLSAERRKLGHLLPRSAAHSGGTARC